MFSRTSVNTKTWGNFRAGIAVAPGPSHHHEPYSRGVERKGSAIVGEGVFAVRIRIQPSDNGNIH
jgi:hypothetical protein